MRDLLRPLAHVEATKRGFVLLPRDTDEVVVLARPVDEIHATLFAFLADMASTCGSLPERVLATIPAPGKGGDRSRDREGHVIKPGNRRHIFGSIWPGLDSPGGCCGRACHRRGTSPTIAP